MSETKAALEIVNKKLDRMTQQELKIMLRQLQQEKKRRSTKKKS